MVIFCSVCILFALLIWALQSAVPVTEQLAGRWREDGVQWMITMAFDSALRFLSPLNLLMVSSVQKPASYSKSFQHSLTQREVTLEKKAR